MLNNKQLFKTGMCWWTYGLVYKDLITEEEGDLLLKYIDNNPPDYFSWANLIEKYKTPKNSEFYYFPVGKLKPRTYWIKRHIKRLK